MTIKFCEKIGRRVDTAQVDGCDNCDCEEIGRPVKPHRSSQQGFVEYPELPLPRYTQRDEPTPEDEDVEQVLALELWGKRLSPQNIGELHFSSLHQIRELKAQLVESNEIIKRMHADNSSLTTQLAGVIEECANKVPTNWCDPLLTGPDAVIKNLDCRQIEALLRGIQDRIRALAVKEGKL